MSDHKLFNAYLVNIFFPFAAVKENLYFEAGKMIAVSLVHGGPSPGFFSKTLFNCLVRGPENVKPALEDVADIDVAQTIKMVNKTELTGKFLFKTIFRNKGFIDYSFSSD